MRRNRGRRFDDEPKLNMKKVIATIIALLVIAMVIASIVMLLNKKNREQQNIERPIEYFSAYTDSKWTVINSKGEEISQVSYDEMIVVPDSQKPIFIVTYDVDYSNGTYKTKAVNERNEQLFTNYENVNAIVNYNSVDDVWYNADVLTYQKDNKYGLIDFSGNEILPAEYEEISSLPGILRNVLVKKDGNYGLYNTSSKTMTIAPQYADIQAFGDTYNDGYIVKDANGKSGLVGSDGNTILANLYDEILKVSGYDKYVVKNGVKTQLISKDNTVLLDTGFDEIVGITANNLIIINAGKYGVITTEGEIVIEAAFDFIEYCFDDYYIVSTGGQYGVINSLKENVIENKYQNIEYRSDIVSFVCENADYTADIYTRDFNQVLTGTITKVDTEAGYICMRVGDNYKYYNLQYQEISSRDALKDNTLFLVKENGKYGYVNRENQKIVDCIYDDAKEQNQFGFCAVKKDGKWGVLQSNGAVLQEPSVELDNNLQIDFIGTWHLSENMELNAYTK